MSINGTNSSCLESNQSAIHNSRENSPFQNIIQGTFLNFIMSPFDRVVSKLSAGQSLNAEQLKNIAKRPMLGAGTSTASLPVGSLISWSSSSYFNKRLSEYLPSFPGFVAAVSSAGGTFLDKLITSPLSTISSHMQREDKSFSTVIREIVFKKRPVRTLYAGAPSVLARDLVYMPICLPAAEYAQNSTSSPSNEYSRTTSSPMFTATATTFLNYTWHYLSPLTTDPTSRLFNTFREHGFSLFKMRAPSRIGLVQGFLGGICAGTEQFFRNLRSKN